MDTHEGISVTGAKQNILHFLSQNVIYYNSKSQNVISATIHMIQEQYILHVTNAGFVYVCVCGGGRLSTLSNCGHS